MNVTYFHKNGHLTDLEATKLVPQKDVKDP